MIARQQMFFIHKQLFQKLNDTNQQMKARSIGANAPLENLNALTIKVHKWTKKIYVQKNKINTCQIAYSYLKLYLFIS